MNWPISFARKPMTTQRFKACVDSVPLAERAPGGPRGPRLHRQKPHAHPSDPGIPNLPGRVDHHRRAASRRSCRGHMRRLRPLSAPPVRPARLCRDGRLRRQPLHQLSDDRTPRRPLPRNGPRRWEDRLCSVATNACWPAPISHAAPVMHEPPDPPSFPNGRV